jgi:hypothetical protein
MTDVLISCPDYRQNWIGRFARERAFYWHSHITALGEVG